MAGPLVDGATGTAGPPRAGRAAFEAVILAGGRGTRLGGADKPGLVVGAATMVAAVTGAAVSAGAGRVILVGPARPDLDHFASRLPGGLAAVREDPPGSGPVPALRAGLALVRAPWMVLLAGDLPFLRAGDIEALLAAADAGAARAGEPSGPAGAVMTDEAGHEQWLVGCWQADRLRQGLLEYRGSSLRGLLTPLRPVALSAAWATGQPPPWLDCDTPGDLAVARASAADQRNTSSLLPNRRLPHDHA